MCSAALEEWLIVTGLTSKSKLKSLADLIFTDTNGDYVFAQKPNIPATVAVTAFIGSKLATSELVESRLGWITFGAVTWWAILEFFDGTTIFRRILGASALLAQLLWVVLQQL